jgi:hypothetical protein
MNLKTSILFGALFYVYFFAWTFSLALLGALAVLAIIKRNSGMLWDLLAMSGIGVLLGSYNLWRMWVTLSSEGGVQTSYFHWSYHTHEPILNILSIFMVLVFAVFAYRKRQDRNLPFIGAFILTFFVVINQQVITGQVVQIGHYHWYFIVPLSIISGLYMLWVLLEGRAWRTLVFRVIIAVVFLHAITGQYRSFFTTVPGKLYEQTYEPLISALAGIYLSGLAGDKLFEKRGTFYNAEDVVGEIGKIVLQYLYHCNKNVTIMA